MKTKFNWEDPLFLNDQLTEDERAVQEAAHTFCQERLQTRVLMAARRLRDEGFPPGTDTCVVMLDGECSFQSLPAEGLSIWWGAYLGMPGEILEHGLLAEAGPRILSARKAARARHGWIMDIYLLRKG